MLLEVRELRKDFPVSRDLFRRSFIRAVDGVSFALRAGECVALVGESGSGKTTTARLVAGLLHPTGGDVLFEGASIFRSDRRRWRLLRRGIQLIFQDPWGSLHPWRTVRENVERGLVLHGLGRPAERRDRVVEALGRVGLGPEWLDRYPAELSGGQAQRVALARALVLGPRLLVADEPASMLDLSVQAQVVALLDELRRSTGMALLFITHDLRLVRRLADRVLVMFRGRIVEEAETAELFGNPLHPYTRILLSAVPEPDPEVRRERLRPLEGEDEGAAACIFFGRCPWRFARCRTEPPPLREAAPGHRAACHLTESQRWPNATSGRPEDELKTP